MEDLPPEVLRQVFNCLPASSVAAAAVAHPALAAVAKTLPELSDVRLRLALRPGGNQCLALHGAHLRSEHREGVASSGHDAVRMGAVCNRLFQIQIMAIHCTNSATCCRG